MPKKLTYEYVKEYIENFGYKLLSTEYISSDIPLLLQCPNGHIYNTTCFRNFKHNNVRCPYCSGGNNIKYTYEEVETYIKSFNYELLSTEYKNNREKLILKCNKGHQYEVSFDVFKRGHRCPYCKKKTISNLRKNSIDDIREYIESFGYKLLSEKYENQDDDLLLECPFGHKFKMSYRRFRKNKTKCEICDGKPKTKKLTYEEVKNYIESFGYKLLSKEYINNKKKLLLECPIGHKWSVKYNKFQLGTRCPICNESKGEKRISEYLSDNNIDFIPQYKFDNLLGIGNGLLSYDFYLPKFNLLIEYQGQFHDGNLTGSYKEDFRLEIQQEHDKRKREYAKENNIKLLEIWYWDYDNIEKILEEQVTFE